VDVVIAGGHGKIALALGRMLAERGDRARGLIRNPDHSTELRGLGIEPLVCDLEDERSDVEAALDGADAVVFAAGAGSGSGPERKWTVDYGGAARTIAASRERGVGRYVIVSAMGAADPPSGDETFAVYLQAKAKADRELMDSGLDWTVVRPGGLTDDPGTGRVSVAASLDRGQIPREDVAATIVAVLDEPRAAGVAFDLVSGETPIEEAVRGLGS
jgi:nucleoside-diphosphate-sugar epimerase